MGAQSLGAANRARAVLVGGRMGPYRSCHRDRLVFHREEPCTIENVRGSRVHALAEKGDYAGAYRLTMDLARYIPDDPVLRYLWPEVSRNLSVHSDPVGAEVAWRPYGELKSSWQPLGRTPLENARLPAGTIRISLTKAGYVPLEVAAPSAENHYRLDKVGAAPPGMVRVPAGALQARYGGIGILKVSRLDEFLMDRYEVTNRQFREFVDHGGYAKRDYWRIPVRKDGRVLSWEQAMALFVDSTGRPGPATWDAGDYPEGRAGYPVAGVSWYEANAYAEFAGKSLPTVYQWLRAAHTDDSPFLIPLSNFGSKGAGPAGISGAVGSYGAFDMAGNVREWCLNNTNGQPYILGGSWADPNYMFTRGQLAPSWDRSATNGFRCVKDAGAGQPSPVLAGPIAPRSALYLPRTNPAGDQVF
jgi:formylglycine-generating enzyme required for sulfatase activity